MGSRTCGLILFAVGIFCMHVYTTASFLWYLIGIPLPYLPIPASIWGFLPSIGAVLMLMGGLVHGQKTKEVTK